MRRISFVMTMLLLAIGAPPAAAQSFGVSAAAGDGAAFFGETGEGRHPGAVFVYRREGGEWGRVNQLSASEGAAGDAFGGAVDVSGDRLVVGAAGVEDGRGAGYVFERGTDGTWNEAARLVPADAAPGDSVGVAVAIDGDLLLLGAAGTDSTPGAVHLFRREAGAWNPSGTLPAQDVGPGDRYGAALDLTGDLAVVGAPNRASETGAVYLFSRQAGTWSQSMVLAGPGGRSQLGAAVHAGPDRLLVGSPGFAQALGSVHVYEPVGEAGEWQETRRLLPFDARPGLGFGSALAGSEDRLWVGAPGVNGFGGAVYAIRRDPGTGEWVEMTRLAPEDVEIEDAFGKAIALDGDVAAAGAPGEDYQAGTGAIFVHEGGRWRLASKVMSELEELDPVVGSPVTCDGEAAGFDCESVDLVSFLPVGALGGKRGVELNDVWGWTDPETDREWALVGRSDATVFVDITDPENPVFVGELPKTDTARGSTWRDIKVYENHAFIVSDNAGPHGMQVFDLTRLRDVEGAPVTFDMDAHYDGFHDAHNVVINTDSGFAYAVGVSGGGETCGGGLHMIDIRDPLNPTFAGCFADRRTGRQRTGYTHDAQCVIYEGPDPDHQGREICFGANETAISIADVTDKANPAAVAIAEYPNAGYTHQGWLTADQRYFLVNDELDEMQGLVENTRTLVWDVSDLDDPVLLTEFLNPNTVSIDHNLYVVGDKVYQSNYVAGLRVVDISDIENPREVGHFDTVPFGDDGPRFDGSWSNYPFFESGTIVVTSGREGLFLLRYRPADQRPVS